eukprot:gene8566-biopygen1606
MDLVFFEPCPGTATSDATLPRLSITAPAPLRRLHRESACGGLPRSPFPTSQPTSAVGHCWCPLTGMACICGGCGLEGRLQ